MRAYYGVELFKRLARGVQPTVFALALEPHARRMLRDMSESQAEMDAIAAGSSGRISVGVGASFIHIVSDTIDEFARHFPLVQFTVTTDHANNLRQALLSNRIDCYLGMANKELEDSIFDVDLIFSDAFVGICAPDHPFVNRAMRPDQAPGT
ncbi:LysR family transcriptional regulator [Devosia algicola]|uniref:LysR family transcriptional regulator n=1 Tax=Devosia algicola TaxID=3026418 RepID=A0ABY7YQ77_9HYPH|nr:LysR family transcriptional regulator [Devosia algicola]WDR03468.1 LysR family transcriptional regulator [Devosia algicola]